VSQPHAQQPVQLQDAEQQPAAVVAAADHVDSTSALSTASAAVDAINAVGASAAITAADGSPAAGSSVAQEHQTVSQAPAAAELYTVSHCRTVEQLQDVFEAAGAQLSPHQLLATLSQLLRIRRMTQGKASDATSSSDDSSAVRGTANFTLQLLQQLLSHPQLYQQQQQQQGAPLCVLSSVGVTKLLSAAAECTEPQPLPGDLRQQLQQLVNSTHVSSSIVGQPQPSEVCSFTGCCLLLGLTPPAAVKQALQQVTAADVGTFSKQVFSAASIILAAATADTDPQQQQQQQQQPGMRTLVDSPEVLAAALHSLAAGSSFRLNSYLGPQRVVRMLLQPLSVLYQLQQQQRLQTVCDMMGDAGVTAAVQVLGKAVQRCISDDMYEQHQQQQQGPSSRALQGRMGGRGRGRNSSSSTSSSTSSSSSFWTVPLAATALTLLWKQLPGVELHPACVQAFSRVAAGQLSKLSDSVLAHLVQLVAAAAAASTAIAATAVAIGTVQPAESAYGGRQPRRYLFRRWRWAVLQHLTASSSKAPLSLLLSAVVTLARQASLEEQDVDSSPNTSPNSPSSNSADVVASAPAAGTGERDSAIQLGQFLTACDDALAAAVQAYPAADNSAGAAVLAQDASAVMQLLPQLCGAGLRPSGATLTGLLGIVVTSSEVAAPADASLKQLLQGLRGQPDHVVYSQLQHLLGPHAAQAVKPAAAAAAAALGAGNSSSSSAAVPGQHPGLAPVVADALDTLRGMTSAPALNMSQLGAAAFVVYSNLDSLDPSSLTAFITSLAALRPKLSASLSPRVSEPQGKVTYSQVVSAAVTAALAAHRQGGAHQRLGVHTLTQLLAGLHQVGFVPDAQQAQGLLVALEADAASMSRLDQQELLLLLESCHSLALQPAGEVLSRLSLRVMEGLQGQGPWPCSSTVSVGGTLQELQQQTAAAASRFVYESWLLTRIGGPVLGDEHTQQLMAAVERCLELSDAAFSSSGSSTGVQLAELLASAVEALAAQGVAVDSSSNSRSSNSRWFTDVAAGAARVLASASASTCCRLASGLAGLGVAGEPSLLTCLVRQVSLTIMALSGKSACSWVCASPLMLMVSDSLMHHGRGVLCMPCMVWNSFVLHRVLAGPCVMQNNTCGLCFASYCMSLTASCCLPCLC
jgi:hypothetical protein